MADNKLVLNGNYITANGVLDLDGSAYVQMTSVDASKNKVLKFNLWLDSSTIYPGSGAALLYYFRSSTAGMDDDKIGILQDSKETMTISITTTSTDLRVSAKFPITNDMLNKVLRCELRKAEKHIHYFKINDTSIPLNLSGSLSGPGSFIGLGVENCATWDAELYDYDTSAFSGNGTLIHKWKGYPNGSTNAAWEDLVGTADGTVVAVSASNYATTRNIAAISSTSVLNKLKFTGINE